MTMTRFDGVGMRRAVSRHRALLAGGLAAGAVAAGLSVVAPEPAEGVAVLTAAHDLAAGTALALTDLRTVRMPPGLVPTGALVTATATVGRVLAAPVRQGEPLTDVRLAGAHLLGAREGLLAVPVRIADAASVALLTAGDRVDLLASSTAAAGTSAARVVAADAEVLAVPTAVTDSADGALLLVATTPTVAATLAAAAVSSRLSLTLRPRP
jgi:Flp pilus assembly protein CpaB